MILEEKKSVKDLSINKVMNNGAIHPGTIANSNLLIDSRDFLHNRENENEYTNFPLREELLIDRDYILLCKGAWIFFKKRYGGVEIKRYSV
jgi:hypothetical protein